ncbi:hypothetical protein ACJJTC_006019 [Scirpophaga incertulas]
MKGLLTTQYNKMASSKILIVILAGIVAFQIAESRKRFVRSPDRVEMELPSYSAERDDQGQVFNDQRKDEEEYWQAEGERGKDKFNQMQEDRDQNGEQAKQEYKDEKHHYEEQQETFNKEVEERYESNRDKFEENYKTNEEHYNDRQGQFNGGNSGNKTAEDMKGEFNSKGGRYGDKGSEYAKDREQDMRDFEMEGKGPSIIYHND